MKTLLTINFPKGHQIIWGQPTTEAEMEEMFQLRLRLYQRKKLISNPELTRDFDFMDAKGCHYFIAKYGNQIIGSTRMIFNQDLPTERRYFDLDLPEELECTKPEQKVEIGRLTSDLGLVPDGIPRHIVLLGFFFVMLRFAYKNGYSFALGTVKSHVKRKFDLIGFPVTYIPYRKLIYDPKQSNDPLDNFFDAQITGGVHPMYIHVSRIDAYLRKLFLNPLLFQRRNDEELVLRNNLIFNVVLGARVAINYLLLRIGFKR